MSVVCDMYHTKPLDLISGWYIITNNETANISQEDRTMPNLVSYNGIAIKTRADARNVKRMIEKNHNVSARVVDNGITSVRRWAVAITSKARQTLHIDRKPLGNTLARYETETLTQTRYNGLNAAYKKAVRQVKVYIKPNYKRRMLHVV